MSTRATATSYLWRRISSAGTRATDTPKTRAAARLFPSSVDAQFGTPYPRSAGFDTDIGAFIESSTVPSTKGSMARLVLKDNITSGGALASGQTLRLGSFVLIARSAVGPTMTSRVIENRLHVSSEYAEQMDPMELSSLNRLLDRIAALGVASD